jgi:hypothetical protein
MAAAPEKATIVGDYVRIPSRSIPERRGNAVYHLIKNVPHFSLEYTGLYIAQGPSISYKDMGPNPETFLQQFHRAVMGENVPGTIPIPAYNNLAERGGTRKNKRQSRRKTSYRRAK